jgi:hypothetical protein
MNLDPVRVLPVFIGQRRVVNSQEFRDEDILGRVQAQRGTRQKDKET